MPSTIQLKVCEHMFETLENGTAGYDEFIQPTHMLKKFKVYFFEVVNAQGVREKYEKPIVEEAGPYVYDVKTTRTLTKLNFATQTIEFFETNQYIFNEVESKDRGEDDMVMILHVLAKGMESKLKEGAIIPKDLSDQIINDPKLKKLFIKTRVKDILFGGIMIDCSDEAAIVCDYLRMDNPQYITLHDKKLKFSLFGHANNSNIGPFKMYLGKENFATGTILSYNGLEKWKEWKTSEGECYILRGSKFLFPALPFAIPKIYVFLNELCRSMDFVFDNYTTFRDIPTYTYVSTKKSFDNIQENACYCKGTNFKKYSITCNIKGTMDLKECKKFSIIASYPHFYLGDPALHNFVQGLSPTKDLHESFISIEPKSGTEFSAALRFQLNIKLDKINPGNDTSKPSDGIFPILWFEEVVQPTEGAVEYYASKIYFMKLLRVGKYSLAFSGIFIMSFSVVLLAYRERYLLQYRPQKRHDFSIDILTEDFDLNKVNVNLYPQLINRNVCDSFVGKNQLRLNVPKF